MVTPSPEVFLAGFPPPIVALAHQLRGLVRAALPQATEQVRLGWQLIGLYVPGRRARPVFMGFIIPHTHYVTLGFEYGLLLAAPPGRLLGAAEKLKQVRYLTFTPAGAQSAGLPTAELTRYLHEAAELALMPSPLRRQLLATAQAALHPPP